MLALEVVNVSQNAICPTDISPKGMKEMTMGSNDRDVQLAQRDLANEELTARVAKLTAKGIDEKALNKDPTVRHLRADLRSLNGRLATIDALVEKKKKLAERKAARLAAPKKKKGKKAELVPETKGKGKAKAKAKAKKKKE